jgi:hypothetical protein
MKKAEAQDWLERLSADNWDSLDGELILVNIYLCLKKRLIKAAVLKCFLNDCINASPSKTALQQFVEVCRPLRSGRPAYFALKQVKMQDVDPNEVLVNVVDVKNFGTYILNPSHADVLSRTLPVGIRSLTDEERYDEYLSSVEGTDWSIPGRCLGKPAPGQKNCWFTKRDEVDRLVGASTSYAERANTTRDGLGLIQHGKGASLVSITFQASALHGGTGVEIGEPTFADGINRRYAASQPGSTHLFNCAEHWGTAADLRKFASKAPETCGLPERVCSPVPIDPTEFTPKYLGTITGNRGDKAHDNDNAFSIHLRGSVSNPAMIKFILLRVFP